MFSLPNTEREKREKIKEALIKEEVNEDEIEKYLDIILHVISAVDSNNSTTWKILRYSSDNNDFFAFVEPVNKMYVSCWGNLYLNESHFLQFLNKIHRITEIWKYESENAKPIKCNIVEIDDYDYLLQTRKCFKRLNRYDVFYNFLQYVTEEQDENYEKAIELLYKTKFYSYFFYELNYYRNAGMAFDNDGDIFVCFPSFKKCSTSTAEFVKNPHEFLSNVHNIDPKDAENYTTVIDQCIRDNCIIIENARTFDNENYVLGQQPERSYIHHYIGVEMLKAAYKYKFTLSILKKAVDWLDWRLSNNMHAVLLHILNETKLFDEYKLLLNVMKECEKSNMHLFYNDHTAGSHFCKHFESIRALPQYNATRVDEILPPLIKKNKHELKKCASFYLRDVANDIFAVPHLRLNVTPRSDSLNLHRLIYENQGIKGIKFLISNSETYNPSTDAAKLKICTIHEKNERR